MQKSVIINRGIPASGKSSFSSNIISTLQERGISAISHSTDDFFMVDGNYMFDALKLREYHLKNQDYFEQSLKDDVEVVICDNTNIEPWEAKPYYNLAKRYGYKVILIDFEPRDIELHYQAQSNEDYKHNIPSDVLESMETSYRNYKELTQKYSCPTLNQPKREYNETKQRVVELDEPSEPFYYDSLIKVSLNDYEKVKEIIGELILKKIRDYSLNEIKLIPKHYLIIMQEFEKRADKTLTAYDLENRLEKSIKQIERDILKLQSEFHNIINFKRNKKNTYKLIDTFEVFIEAFNNIDEFDELFYLAQDSNPELFKKLEYHTTKENNPYIFKNSIFETVENRDDFNSLKNAIKNNKYREIKFFDDDTKYEVKCIKLVFVDNNWYLAYVDSDDILKLGRVSFLEEVKYASKIIYQKSSIEKHLLNLKNNLQNSMTLFDKKPQTATIKANPNISKYFKKDMKKFLSSQEFKKELEDGSVIFTIKYTQPLEILPFIQKWIPDLIILEPEELKNEYIQKIEATLINLKE